MNDDFDEIRNLEMRAAQLKAEAAIQRARADENLKIALKNLENLIQDYEAGLEVCPQIRLLMLQNPRLKDCYPRYWNLCAL